MNPLYDLYRMPRNIDMDYYKKNYRGEGTWTSNIYGYYNDQKQWVPDGTIELSGRCNNGPIFHRVTIIPIG